MNIRSILSYCILYLEDRLGIHIFPSHIYLRAAYFAAFHRTLNLIKPSAFTEKLQWMKLNDKNPQYAYISDKLLVKEYIKNKVGDRFVVDTLGYWDSVQDINLNKLPTKFVIKCTHDCGSMTAVNQHTDDWTKITHQLSNCLKRNYYYVTREWCYKNIKPRIMVEPFLEDKEGKLWDYKFFCFSGKVHFFKIDFDRFNNHRANYYSPNGSYLNFGERDYPRDPFRIANMPIELSEMISIAEKLSEDFYFVRVDMYNIDGTIKVGELTLYPGSGLLRYEPDEWDYSIGALLNLPADYISKG